MRTNFQSTRKVDSADVGQPFQADVRLRSLTYNTKLSAVPLRRRGRGLALVVIAVAASLPQMARAQQSGLFPLHPIKRHRVPCSQEDPIYKINKYQYFGYHPTCWHRFPDGWGCPSAEAPNREKSFAETPLGSGGAAEGELAPQPEERPEMEAPTPKPRTLPAVPRGESPFETPPAAPGGAPPATPNRGQTPPVRDPFESPDVRPQDNPPAQPAPANPPRGNAPDLSAPADQPGQNPTPRAARDEGDGPAIADADGPTLALPNINLPPLADAGSIYEPPPAQTPNAGNAVAAGTPSTQPRRGVISGFLNNLGINWIRR